MKPLKYNNLQTTKTPKGVNVMFEIFTKGDVEYMTIATDDTFNIVQLEATYEPIEPNKWWMFWKKK